MNKVNFLEYKTLPQVKKMSAPPCFGVKGNGLVTVDELDVPVPDTILFDLNSLDRWLEKSLPVYRSVLDLCARWVTPQVQKTLLNFREKGLELLSVRGIPIDFDKVIKFLGDGDWIIRSSMGVKDSEASSFSGSFASVKVSAKDGKEALSRACLEVLFSAFQESAQGSAMTRILSAGQNPREFQSGFLIQKYISPRLSGICLTRDPSQIWNKNQGRVEWGNQFSQRLDATPADLETFWERIWEYSDLIESQFNGPAEWEWVWDGEMLWVLQARRIATAEAKLVARTRKGRRWSRALTVERFPQPMTPMGWTVLQDGFLTQLRSLEKRLGMVSRHPEDMTANINGVIYSDPVFFRFPEGVKIRWSHYFTPCRKVFWELGSRVFFGGLKLITRKSWKVKRALIKLSILDVLMDEQSLDIEKNREMHRDRCLGRIDRFQKSIQSNRSQNPLEILARMETLKNLGQEFMEPDLATFLIKDNYYKAIQDLWEALGRNPAQLTQTMRVLSRNNTLEMNQEWEEFLGTLRLEPLQSVRRFLQVLEKSKGREQALFAAAGLSSKAKQAWQSFLTKNSHLRTSWDVAFPGWGESAYELVPLLRVALQKPSHRVIGVGQNSAVSAYTLLFQEFSHDLQRLHLQSYGRLVEKSLRRIETFIRMDKDQHSLLGVLLDPSRDLVLSAAEILVEENLLAQPEDVFFMELDELKDQLIQSPCSRTSQQFVTQRRKSEWKHACQSKFPFELNLIKEEFQNEKAPPSELYLPGMQVKINDTPSFVEVLDLKNS
jgi:hypothetical protein